MKDFPISQLALVSVFFWHEEPDKRVVSPVRIHYMHEDQVDTFVQATIRLHHEPGINPHNEAPTARLWEITVNGLETETKTYWWCHPDLRGSTGGAKLNKPTITGKRKFACSQLLAYEEWEDNK